jgi:recombination protein RecA
MAVSKLAAHAAKMQQAWGDRAVTAVPDKRQVIPTGSLQVDWVLRGGWPVGRIVELLGPPDTGKSTLALSSLREAQAMFPDRGVCYVDMEGTFDYDWAAGLGLQCSDDDIRAGRWLHMYPRNSEEASDMAREQAATGLFSMITLDSVGGMESKKAFDKEAEKDTVGKNAQVITRMVKHLASLTRQYQIATLLINQPRAVISSMGLPDQSAGPKAMQHQTSVKLQMSKGGEAPRKLKIEDGEDPETVSVQVKARLTRSKVTPVGRNAEFWINNRPTQEYGPPGIFAADEYATLGLRAGVIAQGSSWYTFPDGRKVQGRNEIGPFLQSRPALMAALREEILAKLA